MISPKPNRCAILIGDFFYSTNPTASFTPFSVVLHSFTKPEPAAKRRLARSRLSDRLQANLKVKTQFGRQRSRRDVMRPAERRKKVVERILVGHIDGRQAQTHPVLVALEYVVVPDRYIEQVSRRDARRILVVVLRVWRRHLQQTRPELRYRTRVRKSLRRSRPERSAEQPRLEFLIGAERNSERIRHGNCRLPRRSHGGLGAVAAVAGSLPGDLDRKSVV